MLLTITTTHQPANDLGYLLHKHPERFQSFDLSFGKAHVYYPEVSAERCSACLLLDVDAVGMVRGRNADQSFLLAQYVNDRPYAASSFMSVVELAPFHLLATEGHVHTDKNHVWHMDTLAKVCREAPDLLLATSYKLVDVTDQAKVEEGAGWWTELTGRGGEGMVVKPLDFILRGRRGMTQPAVKCRGRQYLRIIYGPDYTAEENISRLRSRGLGHKRSLALGEFALGIEGLERFVRKEPLRRVHECVFGVLALESEPVDPRL